MRTTRAFRAVADAEAGEAAGALQAVAFQEALHRAEPEHGALLGQRVAKRADAEARPPLQKTDDPLPLRLDPPGLEVAAPAAEETGPQPKRSDGYLSAVPAAYRQKYAIVAAFVAIPL